MTANEIMLHALLGKWFEKTYPTKTGLYLYADKLEYGGIQMIAYNGADKKFVPQFWRKLPSFRSLTLIEDNKLIGKLNARKAKWLLKKGFDETEKD